MQHCAMTPKLFVPHFKHPMYGILPGGIIWSVDKNRALRAKPPKRGYIKHEFQFGGMYAHNFIWECFHGCPLPKSQIVYHKDRDRFNNDPKNLKAGEISDELARPDHYIPHWRDSAYGITADGHVWSCLRQRTVGTVRADGYLRFNFPWGAMYAHVFVWECVHGCEAPAGHDVDHIDSDRCNNTPSNLQLLTKSQHCLKTGRPKHRGGMRQNVNSADYAVLWQYPYRGVGVTRDGRVVNKFGQLKTQFLNGGYLRAACNDHRFIGVHTLVCAAYHGSPPSEQCTADHIDKNPQNNHADNLRWATPQQQALNKTSSFGVRAVDAKTSEVLGTWPSSKAAADAMGVSASTISTCKRKIRLEKVV